MASLAPLCGEAPKKIVAAVPSLTRIEMESCYLFAAMTSKEKRSNPDLLWASSNNLAEAHIEHLSQAVQRHRGRDLVTRVFFEDGKPDELYEHARDLSPERIYVAGGDGTINLAVQSGIDSATYGILPFGTGNDFARCVGIPVADWKAAIDIAVAGEAVKCDLGSLNGRRFANAVTVGFGAEATRDLDSRIKALAGGIAYPVYTLFKAFNAEPFELSLEWEDGKWEGRALAMIGLNGRTIGGGGEVGRLSSINDGILDLAWLPEAEAFDLPSLLRDAGQEDPFQFEKLQYRQAARFEVNLSRPVAVSVDGEVDEIKEFVFECLPEAIRIASP
jgi:diacylglycerol kinase (ATP)